MESLEIINYRGYKINIYSDENCESPREWDNLGKMICFHPNYNLGDKHSFASPEDFKESLTGNEVILPLYLYDHSGITMNTTGFSCNWDSGKVGWIYADLEQLQKMGHTWKKFTAKRKEQVVEWLKSDVKIYDDYLTGATYGYMIEDLEGNEEGGCWGFYGDDFKDSGLLEHAKNDIDSEIYNRVQDRIKEVKNYILNKVPFIYRKYTTAL